MRSLLVLVCLTSVARADDEPSEFYGYQTMIGGAAVAGLGIWTSYADMSRDNHVGVGTLLICAGAGVGPAINWANDGYRLGKLRLSSQLAGGGLALGFVVGAGIELQAYDKDSTHTTDWSKIFALAFGGMGAGQIIDGLVLGHTSSGPPDKFQMFAMPTRGGATLTLGGRF
jgi:hypothetical protein